MHSHQLYGLVRVECLCCHLKQRFHFKSKYDVVVCSGCQSHHGDTANQSTKRDAQHLQMWQSELGLVREQHTQRLVALEHKLGERDIKIEALNGHVSDLEGALKAGLDSRPVEAIAVWFENSKITEAIQSKERTQRFADRLFGYIWQLDELHHSDDGAALCSCGGRADKCEELALLEPIRNALYKWEREQRDRLMARKQHGLPKMHPDVIKFERNHRWSA